MARDKGIRVTKGYVKSPRRMKVTPEERVAIACEFSGEHQNVIAKRAKISESALSDIIHGRRKMGRDVAARLAVALNIPLHRLLGVDDVSSLREHAAEDILQKVKSKLQRGHKIDEKTGRILLKEIEEYEQAIHHSA